MDLAKIIIRKCVCYKGEKGVYSLLKKKTKDK